MILFAVNIRKTRMYSQADCAESVKIADYFAVLVLEKTYYKSDDNH